MSSEDGGAAFPCNRTVGPDGGPVEDFRAYGTGSEGMTLRQYAAIKLRVPNSGTDWLDAMITESLRNEFAGQAMRGHWANPDPEMIRWSRDYKGCAAGCFGMADAMLKARHP